MASFVRIMVLVWGDVLAGYAMWVMMIYLTDVWKLSFTHAAGIINIWGGIAMTLPFGLAFIVDTVLGNYAMLLLSSIAYSIGLGFLTMSTPPVLSGSTGTCSAYQPNCIGYTQKALFYAALALIAVGISGHIVSLGSFLAEQISRQTGDDGDDTGGKVPFQLAGAFMVVLVPIIGGIALPYINPWSLRFGIPAICTLTATILYVSGSCSYVYTKPQGSPLTKLFRVFVASASKVFRRFDGEKHYKNDDPDLEFMVYTRRLRCLDNAAIILPSKSREEQEKNRWTLCSIPEVEETKIAICMIPMWMTFIICGVVISIGNTYFLEQANHMNREVGKLKVPLPILLLLHDWAKSLFSKVYASLSRYFKNLLLKSYAPAAGIIMAMILSILCCITAAKVESRRLHVIRKHGLLDKPEDRIPMSIFWLLPQFVLLAGVDSFYDNSVTRFFIDQSPPSMRSYSVIFTTGVSGLGFMASVLTVYATGKASARGGKPSRFQYTLNKSRLDNYYWTLAAISAVNLVLYLLVASLYSFREAADLDEEDGENGESTEPYDEDNTKCCCC